MFGALLWAYSATFQDLARKWDADPLYSHGFLVPVFALALLWFRRDLLPTGNFRPSLVGLAVLACSLAVRHAASYYYIEWFEHLSIVGCTLGIVLLAGGWSALRWAWPACLFLTFMLPLPFSLEVALRDPLRRIGTVASTYVMQTLGMPAFAEGTVIVVNDVRIGVVEACSGLGMLMIFFALSTAVALVVQQSAWRRLLLVASAVPIALIANVMRITVAGSFHAMGYHRFADLVFHDRLAGPFMMGIGLLLLWAEMALLDRLIIVESDEPVELFRTPVSAGATQRDSNTMASSAAAPASRML